MNKENYGGIEILKSVLVFLGFVFVPSLIYLFLEKLNIKGDLLLTLLSELIYILFIVYIYKDTLISDFKTFKKKNLKIMAKWWLIGLIIMIASNAFINFVVFKGEIAANEAQNREILTTLPVLGLILAGVLAPILEELTFRRGFRKITKNNYLFVFISAFVFAGLHVLTGLFDENMKIQLLQLLYFIPYGSLGASFAIIYAKTDNIYSSMLTHAFHNTLTLLLILTV